MTAVPVTNYIYVITLKQLCFTFDYMPQHIFKVEYILFTQLEDLLSKRCAHTRHFKVENLYSIKTIDTSRL